MMRMLERIVFHTEFRGIVAAQGRTQGSPLQEQMRLAQGFLEIHQTPSRTRILEIANKSSQTVFLIYPTSSNAPTT